MPQRREPKMQSPAGAERAQNPMNALRKAATIGPDPTMGTGQSPEQLQLLQELAMMGTGNMGKFGPDDVPAAGMQYLRDVLGSMYDAVAGSARRSPVMPKTSAATANMMDEMGMRARDGRMNTPRVLSTVADRSKDSIYINSAFGKGAKDVDFPMPSPGATPPRPSLRGLNDAGGDALEKGSMYGVGRARDASNAALRDLGQPPGSADDIGGLGLLKLIESIMTDPSSARKLFGR